MAVPSKSVSSSSSNSPSSSSWASSTAATPAFPFLAGNGDFHQPALRFHLFDARTVALFRLFRGSSTDLASGSSTPFARAEVSSFEMSSSVVVDVVLFVIDALLADFEFPLRLGHRGNDWRLHADPDSLDRSVDVLPVPAQLVRASEGGFAFWRWALEGFLVFGCEGRREMSCFWLAMGLGAGLLRGFVALGRRGCATPLAICFWRRMAAFFWGESEELLDVVEVLAWEAVRFMSV